MTYARAASCGTGFFAALAYAARCFLKQRNRRADDGRLR